MYLFTVLFIYYLFLFPIERQHCIKYVDDRLFIERKKTNDVLD